MTGLRARLGCVVLVAALAGCAGRHGGASATVGSVHLTRAVAWGFTGSKTVTIGFHATSEGVDDSLVGVRSSIGGNAALHDIAPGNQMITVPAIELPAGHDVALGISGGPHIMIEQLPHDEAPGDTIAITLQFARAGKLDLRVPVTRYGDAQALLK